MRGFEGQVRRAVEAGEDVDYRVTPVWDPDDLSNKIPLGVTMEARGSGGFNLQLSVRNIPKY